LPLIRAALRTALREELDIHSAFTFEKFLREGVDAHFNCRYVDLEYTHKLGRASEFWKQIEYKSPFGGYLVCPADKWAVSLYGKRSVPYGVLTVRAKMPSLTKDGQSVYFGFECGSEAGTGQAYFLYRRVAGVEEMRAVIGGFLGIGGQNPDITTLLPADYKTVEHTYSIVVMKHLVEWYIDETLAAVSLNCPRLAIPVTAWNPPPYGIGRTIGLMSQSITPLLEVTGHADELRFELSPYNFRVTQGDPLPPRVWRLYKSGSSDLLADQTISAGSITSHPIPLIGYDEKTFYFRASQAGTLDIEVLTLTNNWRTYDSVSVSADILLSYTMLGNVILARVTYTPTSYPATVSESEAVLR